MSSNVTPESRTVLIALAKKMNQGQFTNQVSVGLLHHLAVGMDAAIKKLTGDPSAGVGTNANKGSQLAYRDCVDATGDAEAALRKLSDTTVKTWLDGYKTVMETVHGKKAGDGWAAAGFVNGRPVVPRNHDQRHSLLEAARSYLAAHGTYETNLPQKAGPPLAVSAATALTLHTDMQTAMTLIDTCSTEQQTCKLVRDTDVDALYDEVSGTIAELRDLLGDADPRWEVFGLNIPAHPNAPEGVTTFTLTSAGTGRELGEWSYAARAEYYRLFLQRVGVDADFVNVADPRDLEFTLKALTPGTVIKAYVVPMNGGGAGPASPVVEKTVPA